jgi:nicotinamide-nucleotide amidase
MMAADSGPLADADVLFPAHLITLASDVIDALRDKHATISFAESCTGGLLSALVTSIAGSSDVLDYGFVTYSNAAKTDLLGVPQDLLTLHGAVSPEVAASMATGARIRSGSSIAIAVTGIAGPGGGSAEKPVGLVYIGVCSPTGPAKIHELRLGNISRASIRLKTTEAAIALAHAACRDLS